MTADATLTVGSLFSGIGGFDLGLERAGMRTLWFCERDEFCRRVLARHWPGVPCYSDVAELVADDQVNGRGPGRTRRSDPSGEGQQQPALPVAYVDVLCGGFPCQDISLAGRGAGINGSRSGLWREFARLIGELRPRYVIVENVPALTSRGLDVVLADLAACGFDAEWDHLPASAFGAPHRRDRIWLVAYPGHGGESERARSAGREVGERSAVGCESRRDGPQEPVAYPDGSGSQGHGGPIERPGELAAAQGCAAGGAGAVADADEQGRERGELPGRTQSGRSAAAEGCSPYGSDAEFAGPQGVGGTGRPDGAGSAGQSERPSSSRGAGRRREPEPGVGRVAHGAASGLDGHWLEEPEGVPRVAVGVPQRVDRLRALGNALVPQIAEWIGRRIVAWEDDHQRDDPASLRLEPRVGTGS